jgi:pyrrolidone-carboxylate peptidase
MMASAGVEEARLSSAVSELPGVADRYRSYAQEAGGVSSSSELEDLGLRLWRQAVKDVQSRQTDDRALYWGRLMVREAVQAARPGLPLGVFERASRGMTDTVFPEGARRVLISGFDPFLLDEHIDQSNPSGLAALSLDGVTLETGAGPVHVEALLVPVRFLDFDEGLIEATFRPMLENGDLDLLLTVSMGRDAFDLERFPGRRRSAAVVDNLNVLTGASADNPLVPRLGDRVFDGPEFVEFSLPAGAMAAAAGFWAVRDNRSVTTLERGPMEPAALAELDGLTAVRGSGGGYLSNEISYRTVRLARELGSTVPVGHLHTPRVAGYDGEAERRMVEDIRRIIIAAVEAGAGR